MPPPLNPRIILIEDDPGRTDRIAHWLAGTEFVLVVARSGGQALGLLGKGSTAAIAGLMLDHDLSDSPLTEMDRQLSTSNVMPLVIQRVRRSVPVLIHSHNASKPASMQRMLEAAGFSVTRIRFAELTEERFREWLQETRDNWEPGE